MNEYELAVSYYLCFHQLEGKVEKVQDPLNVGDSSLELILEKESPTKDSQWKSEEVVDNTEIIDSSTGSIFSAAGPAPFQGDILERPDLVWTEDVWTAEKEEKAIESIKSQGDPITPYWRNHYVNKAGSYWNDFYKRNQDHFYKDRHYIHVVFPELSTISNTTKYLLEVGCGVGNAVLPLLDINPSLHITAIDFAKSAIQILQNTIATKLPTEKQQRMTAAVCNIANDPLPVPSNSLDYTLCMFVLSAVPPECHISVFKKLYMGLKSGGKLFFRDYGRYDEAQLRFKKGCKLDDHFYVRQDGTCSYFFTIEELTEIVTTIGFQIEELYYIYRQYANRQQRKARYRVWVHCKLIKP